MSKVTRFYGIVDNVGGGTLKHGAEDYPEVPILDGVTLDDRHRAQSEFWFETGADSVRFIGTATHVGVEVTYSFYPHFSRTQLMTFYRLLGKEVLTVETECEDGIYPDTDTEQLEKLILEAASLRYNDCPYDNRDKTIPMIDMLTKHEPTAELDIELVKSVVKYIIIDNGVISAELVNGVIIPSQGE